MIVCTERRRLIHIPVFRLLSCYVKEGSIMIVCTERRRLLLLPIQILETGKNSILQVSVRWQLTRKRL